MTRREFIIKASSIKMVCVNGHYHDYMYKNKLGKLVRMCSKCKAEASLAYYYRKMKWLHE